MSDCNHEFVTVESSGPYSECKHCSLPEETWLARELASVCAALATSEAARAQAETRLAELSKELDATTDDLKQSRRAAEDMWRQRDRALESLSITNDNATTDARHLREKLAQAEKERDEARECVRRGNSSMEEIERDLYLRLDAAEQQVMEYQCEVREPSSISSAHLVAAVISVDVGVKALLNERDDLRRRISEMETRHAEQLRRVAEAVRDACVDEVDEWWVECSLAKVNLDAILAEAVKS